MKRVGDIRQIAGNQNSAEIDGLVRFAVDEQNKKQVCFLIFPFSFAPSSRRTRWGDAKKYVAISSSGREEKLA